MDLVVVESPTKAKTIKKIIGNNFLVVSTMGHIRDLPQRYFGIDLKNNFKPTYVLIPGKKKTIKQLKDAYKKCNFVFLATDGDREGEGIAWHVKEILKISDEKAKRTVFHEITEDAIKQAFSNPQSLNKALVEAYVARRLLDRIVGYKLSPVLWRKVAKGLSAGRVQSAALKLIVEREREIRNFKPRKYWKIAGFFLSQSKKFQAEAVEYRGEKFKEGKIFDEEILKKIKEIEKQEFEVIEKANSQKKNNPSPPFTTSTLQQQANSLFSYSSKKTMTIAQQLYEGIDLPDGKRIGLITYMRTDSVKIAPVAQNYARKFIKEKFGEQFLPKRPPQYKTKSRLAQEAHEAIRPTNVFLVPEKIKESLTKEQFNIYSLIWKRFVASQMKPAVMKTITIKLSRETCIFQATKTIIKEKGYLLLSEGRLKEDEKNREVFKILENLKKGDKVLLEKIEISQHLTQPPPHYTDASLVKILEEKGIGRPSTYASIIDTLIRRSYIYRNKRQLLLKEIGEVVIDLLENFFPLITDYNFTAKVEEKLDLIASSKATSNQVLKEFYENFEKLLENAEKKIKPLTKVLVEKCPWCGANLVEKMTKNGKLHVCSNSGCPYRLYLTDKGVLEPEKMFCPKCGSPMILVVGRRGPFYLCQKYPRCKTTKSYEKGS